MAEERTAGNSSSEVGHRSLDLHHSALGFPPGALGYRWMAREQELVLVQEELVRTRVQ